MSLTFCFPVPGNPWFTESVIPYAVSNNDQLRAVIPMERTSPNDGDQKMVWSNRPGERFLCGDVLYIFADKHPLSAGYFEYGWSQLEGILWSNIEILDLLDKQEIENLGVARTGFYRVTPTRLLLGRWPVPAESTILRLESAVDTLLEVVRAMANRGGAMGDADALASAINRLEQFCAENER